VSGVEVFVSSLADALPASDVAELEWAPPVLTTTPGAAEVVEPVAVEVEFGADSEPAVADVVGAADDEVDPPDDEFDDGSAEAGSEPEVSGAGLAPDDDGELADDDVDDSAVSAFAVPIPVNTAAPMPKATASAPTRPMCAEAPTFRALAVRVNSARSRIRSAGADTVDGITVAWLRPAAIRALAGPVRSSRWPIACPPVWLVPKIRCRLSVVNLAVNRLTNVNGTIRQGLL
jgi:hypothetical protein